METPVKSQENNENINNDIKMSSDTNNDNNSIKSLKEVEISKSENTSENTSENNTILKRIGRFFLYILMSISMGILNFIRNNWLFLLITSIIVYSVYYLYSNAFRYINNILSIFNNIQPMLKSSVDIIDSTLSNIDTSNNVTSIQKNNKSNKSLETKLKSNKNSSKLDDINDDDDDNNNDDNNDDNNNHDNNDDNNNDDDNNKPIKKFHTNNLTESNNNHSTGFEGYCYIGQENGIRTCAPIDKNNKCMSGDIFPTMEKCIYTDLRD